MILFVLAVLAGSFLLLFSYVVLTVIHRPGRKLDVPALPGNPPRVSLLKPVSNLDDAMEENFDTFFRLDYPAYEIIFGMDTEDQRCWTLVREVCARHPEVPAKLVSTVSEKILNPKITTLLNMVGSCTGDIYWLTDSNVRVQPAALRLLVHEYVSNGSKVVFSPIEGTGSGTPASVMENAYLNFFVSGNIIGAWKLFRRQIIVGKSMLIEREALDRLGGFARFREYLAEDFMMGELYLAEGHRVATNFVWVTNYISTATVGRFWGRTVRWETLRFRIKPLFYFLELFTNPIGLMLLFLPLSGRAGVPLLLWVTALKVLLEYVNFFAVNRKDRSKLWIVLSYPFLVILKDILLLLMFPVPFFRNEVDWRGRKIRIGAKSRITGIRPA